MEGVDYEILLVDDRCPENSWKKIVHLSQEYPKLRGVRLSRNFGQQIAITAGLASSTGDYVVVMDGDLQDPPEAIPLMFKKLGKGYDFILGRRAKRSHSKTRLLFASSYFRIMNVINNDSFDGRFGSFSLLSRKVVNSILEFGEKERHYLFILRWVGYKMGSVDYTHAVRSSGKSSYSFNMLIRHAIDGIFFQTTVLLKWIVTLGLLVVLAGIGLALYYVYNFFVQGALPGWTTLVVLLLLCTGCVLFSLGVVGLYVGKIFEQSKNRPLYIIDEQI
jgi:dolichol-phosphate mannosyltransferase|tara:strand:- start:6916 stop:7743 length:828 start_codon:yes stop_codon:yes gene_type:complete